MVSLKRNQRKDCYKKETLTRVEAITIGKAGESTKIEVQECSANLTPERESIKAVSKDKPKKVLMCNYCANKKGAHRVSDKKLCPAWGAVCRKCKPKNHFQDSKENRRDPQIQNNQNQPQDRLY